MKVVKSLVLPVLAICFVFIFYGNVLIHPNSYLFAATGDGLKNYYTYIFHIKNDTSFVNFNGMNYPYGENFMYTDCHPVLSVLIKVLSKFSPGIAGYSIGILNFLMIFSIFVTILLIYKILSLLNIKYWLSVFSAIAIASMAPQLFRLTGHLALSYSCFIPLTIYLLLQHSKADKKYFWMVLLMINNLFWFFIHGYLGMMTVFFQLSYWAISMIINRKDQVGKIHYYIHLFLTVILPLVLFRLFILTTDIHTGRTDNPSGFFLYNAEPDDIFVAHHPPASLLLNKIPGIKINLEWEAWSYVGLTTIIVLLTLLIAWVFTAIKKNKNFGFKIPPVDKELTALILASIILLLFAMGIPFRQLPFLLNWFPLIKQFRATGRFTWFFFFAITIFSIYMVDFSTRNYSKTNKKWAALIVLILAPLMYLVEGIPYHLELGKAIKKEINYFDYNQLPENYTNAIHNIDPKKYQAILSLPFFYQGSESFSRPCQNDICKYSMVMAYHCNLPLVGANLTRTSVEESKRIVQIVSPAFYPKLISNDIKSDKPFLIIKSNETLTANEENILRNCRQLYRNDEFSVYELSKNMLFANTANAEIEDFNILKKSLITKNGFSLTDTSEFLYYEDFENNKNAPAYRGKGAYSGIKSGKNTFAGFPPNTFKSNKEYMASIWMYNNQKDALNNWFRIIVEEHDVNNDTYFTTVCFPEQSETIYGNWSMVELSFSINNPANTICIVSIGKDEDSKIPLVADCLLIRERNSSVYRIETEKAGATTTLFKNNHTIRVW